jgi:glutamyl-tRNA synthetase
MQSVPRYATFSCNLKLKNMTVITRFAPAPTGYLHIGSARTALFNWLFSRHHGGKFLLRIEDTDRERSTQQAIDAIINSMKWLELNWDDDIVYQFSRSARHAEFAQKLLEAGKAYYCYCSQEELTEMREKASKAGQQPRYDGRWRDRDPKDAPPGIKPVIRLKAPQTGQTTIEDHVRGIVTVNNEQLDDFVLLRSDGTPTYMLSVVVDDHDMNISHIIRGEDHLTNTFRQKHLYEALGWTLPEVCHIPLIHGPDGAKLSKRHGALGVEAYKDMGMLPEAMCNYLLRLGWSHGDDEIISRNQAIEWFTLNNIGKAPARLDMDKLLHVNAHYLRQTDNQTLISQIDPMLTEKLGRELTPRDHEKLLAGLDGLKERAQDLNTLADNAMIYCQTPPYPFDEKAEKVLTPESKAVLTKVLEMLSTHQDWSEEALETALRQLGDSLELKFGAIAQPLRAALTGRAVSPGIFEIMRILGPEETLERLRYVL